MLLLASVMQQDAADNAYNAPVHAYLECVKVGAQQRLAEHGPETVRTVDANAIVEKCRPLLADAAAGFAAVMAQSEFVIDYRARYLRSCGHDPDLAALFLPTLRGAAGGLAETILAGGKGPFQAKFKFNLPNPDQDSARKAATAPAGDRPAGPASGSR